MAGDPTLDYLTERMLTFDDGIPGFPEAKRWVLVDLSEDSVFQLLRSLDVPDVEIIVCVPWLYFPDYAPVLEDQDQDGLELESVEDVVLFCAVTLDGESRTATMNLLGPFVVNSRTRRGRQVVLAESEYTTRVPIDLWAD